MRSSAGSPVRGRRCDSVETNIAKVHVKYGICRCFFRPSRIISYVCV